MLILPGVESFKYDIKIYNNVVSLMIFNRMIQNFVILMCE